MLSLPRVIGHRGLAGLAPENTLAAFAAAKSQGLEWVELDTKLCASGELVVCHDNTVDRTSDGHGRVAEMSLARLRRLDMGAWFHPRFAGERLPTLLDVLDFCAQVGLGVNIELKPNPREYRQTVVALARLLKSEQLSDRLPLLLSSFSLQAMRAAHALLPQIPRGWLLERRFDPAIELPRIEHLACASFHYDARLLTPAILRSVREQGRKVLAWTVNDRAQAQTLWDMGVTAVFSDRPLLLAE